METENESEAVPESVPEAMLEAVPEVASQAAPEDAALEEEEESLENLASLGTSSVDPQGKTEGPSLSYTLVMKGIGDKNLQEKVADILKALYSQEELERLFAEKLSHGTLTLTSLYPLQASLLLQHLRELPLDLDWQQVYKYR